MYKHKIYGKVAVICDALRKCGMKCVRDTSYCTTVPCILHCCSSEGAV